jgi:hypothetical protein
MVVHVMCLTTSGGLPLFTRKRGDGEPVRIIDTHVFFFLSHAWTLVQVLPLLLKCGIRLWSSHVRFVQFYFQLRLGAAMFRILFLPCRGRKYALQHGQQRTLPTSFVLIYVLFSVISHCAWWNLSSSDLTWPDLTWPEQM